MRVFSKLFGSWATQEQKSIIKRKTSVLWNRALPLVIDSVSIPSFPEVRDWKYQASIPGWLPWQPASIIRCSPKVTHFINQLWRKFMKNKIHVPPLWLRSIFRNRGQHTNMAPNALIAQEIPRVWGGVSQEPWTKTKYIKYIFCPS